MHHACNIRYELRRVLVLAIEFVSVSKSFVDEIRTTQLLHHVIKIAPWTSTLDLSMVDEKLPLKKALSHSAIFLATCKAILLLLPKSLNCQHHRLELQTHRDV